MGPFVAAGRSMDFKAGRVHVQFTGLPLEPEATAFRILRVWFNKVVTGGTGIRHITPKTTSS